MFFSVGLLAVATHVYSAIARPDLKFRIHNYEGIPAEYGTVAILEASNDNETDTLILMGNYLKKTPNQVDLDFWSAKRNSTPMKRVVSFNFPVDITSHEISIKRPNSHKSHLVQVAVGATDDEFIYVFICMINKNLDIEYESRIKIKYPVGAQGSKLNICAGEITDQIDFNGIFQRYVVFGCFLSSQPASFSEWYNEHQDDTNLSMKDFKPLRQKLGVIIAPAQQNEWLEPSKIINFPASGHVSYVKPCGQPALFVQSGGSANGWYTLPSDELKEISNQEYVNKQSEFQTDDDSWKSFYLVNFSGTIKDRMRIAEYDEENHWGQACQVAFSEHSENDSITEFSILSWSNNAEIAEYTLHNYHTKSNTRDQASWRFEPEKLEGVVINYGQCIIQHTSIETTNRDIGFVLVNDDGSAVLLQQPKWWKPQEIRWETKKLVEEGKIPDYQFTDFLDIVPTHEDMDGYVFGTENNHIVILDENGNLLHDKKIMEHFTMNQNDYSISTGFVFDERNYSNITSPAKLTGPEGITRCEIAANENWKPGWNSVIKNIWISVICLWIIGATLVCRFTREYKFVSEEDHDETISTVHEIHAEQSQLRLGQIADSLAHNLNTPLDAIKHTLINVKEDPLYDIQTEVREILPDNERFNTFGLYLKNLLEYPVKLSISGINSLTDEIDDYLSDKYDNLADYAQKFARNGFSIESINEFISQFGSGDAGKLINIIDRVVGQQRKLIVSLEQMDIAFTLANRLKNIVKKNECDIKLSLETSLQMIEAPLVSRKIKLDLSLDDLPLIKGESLLMIEICNNILSNAVDALPLGGKIEIELKRVDDIAVLKISNNGPKIPDEVINNIFDRGFTHGKNHGRGLGLHLAKEMVEKLGGKIIVFSDSVLTYFELTFPLVIHEDSGN